MTKQYSERKMLTKAQVREAGMEFLKQNDFFGLNPEHLEMGSIFGEIVNRSTDKFTVIREITASILKLEQQGEVIAKKIEAQRIKEANAKIQEQAGDEDGNPHVPTVIKSMAINFVNDKDMTIGEVLAEVLNRYRDANLLDVKLSDIKTDEAQLAATSKLMEAGFDKFAIGYDEHTCCEYADAISQHNAEVMKEYVLPLIQKTQSPLVPFGFESNLAFGFAPADGILKTPIKVVMVKR